MSFEPTRVTQPSRSNKHYSKEGHSSIVGTDSENKPPHLLSLDQNVVARHTREMPGPNLTRMGAYRQAMSMRVSAMGELPWATTRSSRSPAIRAGSLGPDGDSQSMGMRTPPRYASVPLRTPSPLVPDAGEESEFTDGGSEKRGSARRRRSKQFGGPLTTLPIISYEKKKKVKGRSKLYDPDKEECDYSTGDEGSSERQSQRSSTLVHRRSESPFTTPPLAGKPNTEDSHNNDDSVDDVDELDVVDRLPPLRPLSPEMSCVAQEEDHQEHDEETEHERSAPLDPPPRGTGPNHKISLTIASLLTSINSRIHGLNVEQPSRLVETTSTFVKRVQSNVSTAWERARQQRRRNAWSSFMTLLAICLMFYAIFHDVNRFYSNSASSTYISKALNVIPMRNVQGLQERLSVMQQEISHTRSELSSMRQSISRIHAGKHHDMSALVEIQGKHRAMLERLVLMESRVEKEMTQLQVYTNSQRANLSKDEELLLSLKDTIEQLTTSVLQDRGLLDVNRVDFALKTQGGDVIKWLTHPLHSFKSSFFSSIRNGMFTSSRGPESALSPELHPGQCWPFKGSRGQLGVRLVKSVYVDSVTIDHVERSLAISVGSAPRFMEVWGLVEGEENLKKFQEANVTVEEGASQGDADQTRFAMAQTTIQDEVRTLRPPRLPNTQTFVRIASFEYDINSPRNVQRFPVLEGVQDLGIPFQTVVLNIDGNWGDDEYTCLYRFRVHGNLNLHENYV